MLEQPTRVSPEVKDRLISLLLMVLFLILGVAWGMAVAEELKSGSTRLTVSKGQISNRDSAR